MQVFSREIDPIGDKEDADWRAGVGGFCSPGMCNRSGNIIFTVSMGMRSPTAPWDWIASASRDPLLRPCEDYCGKETLVVRRMTA